MTIERTIEIIGTDRMGYTEIVFRPCGHTARLDASRGDPAAARCWRCEAEERRGKSTVEAAGQAGWTYLYRVLLEGEEYGVIVVKRPQSKGDTMYQFNIESAGTGAFYPTHNDALAEAIRRLEQSTYRYHESWW